MAEAMSSVERRGACPSLDAPMRTGDGLLARLRIAGGSLNPLQMLTICRAAEQFGNGLIEITKRGNLQVRGLREADVARFGAAIEAAIPIQRGLVVEVPPLAGIDPTELADPRPLAHKIQQRSQLVGLDYRLGPKVTVVIDGQGQIGLAALGADVRMVAQPGGFWALSVGGNSIGQITEATAPDAVIVVLALVADQGLAARGRDVAPAQVQSALGTQLVPHPAIHTPAHNATLGRLTLHDGLAHLIALPFGASTAAQLASLAKAAIANDIGEFRLSPGHGLLAIGQTESLDNWRDTACALGFVTGPLDARQSISACAGTEGCASGHIAARTFASEIARRHGAFFDGSLDLHVSGCAKGCAHPRAAALTIVGGADNCGLVLHGRAGDMPLANFAGNRLESAFDGLARLIRRQRRPEETVAACLERLDAPTIAGAIRQE